MIEIITNVNSAINNVVWGWPALILLGFIFQCILAFGDAKYEGPQY